MLGTVLAWLGSGFGGQIISGALGAYQKKLDAGVSEKTLASALATKELELQAKEAELNNQLRIASIGKWYEPEHMFAYIMVTYFGKIVLWDKVFSLGSTDALHGDAATWAGLILTALFGKRGFENVARIWASRK
jgi:hypothetical protein